MKKEQLLRILNRIEKEEILSPDELQKILSLSAQEIFTIENHFNVLTKEMRRAIVTNPTILDYFEKLPVNIKVTPEQQMKLASCSEREINILFHTLSQVSMEDTEDLWNLMMGKDHLNDLEQIINDIDCIQKSTTLQELEKKQFFTRPVLDIGKDTNSKIDFKKVLQYAKYIANSPRTEYQGTLIDFVLNPIILAQPKLWDYLTKMQMTYAPIDSKQLNKWIPILLNKDLSEKEKCFLLEQIGLKKENNIERIINQYKETKNKMESLLHSTYFQNRPVQSALFKEKIMDTFQYFRYDFMKDTIDCYDWETVLKKTWAIREPRQFEFLLFYILYDCEAKTSQAAGIRSIFENEVLAKEENKAVADQVADLLIKYSKYRIKGFVELFGNDSPLTIEEMKEIVKRPSLLVAKGIYRKDFESSFVPMALAKELRNEHALWVDALNRMEECQEEKEFLRKEIASVAMNKDLLKRPKTRENVLNIVSNLDEMIASDASPIVQILTRKELIDEDNLYEQIVIDFEEFIAKKRPFQKAYRGVYCNEKLLKDPNKYRYAIEQLRMAIDLGYGKAFVQLVADAQELESTRFEEVIDEFMITIENAARSNQNEFQNKLIASLDGKTLKEVLEEEQITTEELKKYLKFAQEEITLDMTPDSKQFIYSLNIPSRMKQSVDKPKPHPLPFTPSWIIQRNLSQKMIQYVIPKNHYRNENIPQFEDTYFDTNWDIMIQSDNGEVLIKKPLHRK